MNHVVARFKDGTTLKGQTNDFYHAKDRFHVSAPGAGPAAKPLLVMVQELKALYFVKTLGGDPQRRKSNRFPPIAPNSGRRIQVAFWDGEILVGMTPGIHPDRLGFFLIPADPESNNERCFVVASATRTVTYLAA